MAVIKVFKGGGGVRPKIQPNKGDPLRDVETNTPGLTCTNHALPGPRGNRGRGGGGGEVKSSQCGPN